MTTTRRGTVPRLRPGVGVSALLRLAPFAGILLVLGLAAVTTPGIYGEAALRIVLFQIGIIGITAVGQTLVLLTAGIDLSVGAVIGLAAVIVAERTGPQGQHLFTAVSLALLAGVVVGGVNAALVLFRNVPPFVATFATFVLVQGCITAWTQGAPSGSVPDQLTPLGVATPLGVPTATWIFLALAALAYVVLSWTTLGRRLYAAGANRATAKMTGIRSAPLFASAYVISALLAVLAGLVFAAYVGRVDAELARTLNLDSIAAAVIGGVALTGGRGGIGNTIPGVVLLALLLVWMIQLGAGAGGQLLVEGVVILLAAWLQQGSSRRRIT